MAPKPDPSPSNAQRNSANVQRAIARIQRGKQYGPRTLARLRSAGYSTGALRKLTQDAGRYNRGLT